MGTGGPLEAEYTLEAPIPAGDWHIVADGIILEAVDVHFDIIWRESGGDHVLVSFDHHFDPLPAGNFDAVPYEDTGAGVAAPAHAGDQLILRYSATNATKAMAYIPNGDGPTHNGRFPFIDLPK